MQKASAAYERLLNGLAAAAALILLGAVLLVTADILLRNLTRSGFPWANEVSEYALFFITVLTAPWLLRRGQHVRLDLLLAAVPGRLAWLMEVMADLVGFAICVVLVRYSLIMTWDSWRLGSITIKNLVFPEWWTLAPLPVCLILLTVEFVFRFQRLLAGEKGRRREATSVG
ncbi:MAG: TRAP transporter small permease [Alphaproteobacteria bacterium]|nr:TRAP transporter small permease [Alphaproteobacteria bacterium]